MTKPLEDTALGDSDVAKTLGAELARGPSRRWRLWALGALALALAGAGIWYFVFASAGGTTYRTEAVKRATLRIVVSTTGQIQPINEVEVGAEISGLVAEVLVDFNDRVSIGQVLARLDTEQLRARVLQAEANLAQARAGIAQAEATQREAQTRRARTAALAERGISSARELDVDDASLARARAGVDSAKAQLLVAEAQLAVDRANLDKAEIRSPVNGIVLDRRVEPGQAVASQFQTPVLFVLAEDLATMELQVDIDEADIGEVREGQGATFTVDAYPTRTFTGQVTQLRNAPQTVNGVVSYTGILKVPNADLALKPGMTANADIEVDTVENALLVPNAALRFTPPDRAFDAVEQAEGERRGRVWVMGAFGLAPRLILLGRTDDQWTEVLSAEVQEGDRVAIDIGGTGGTAALSAPPPATSSASGAVKRGATRAVLSRS